MITPTSITRTLDTTAVDIRKGKRLVRAIVNDESVDHYRTVIDPFGADLDGYMRNPVCLYEHGKSQPRGTLPIGSCVAIGNERIKGMECLVATIKFSPDEFSDMLFESYASGAMRGWSVNMLPREASPPTPQEIRARPDLASCEMVYRSWKLMELSAVAIPGNANALTMGVERSSWAALNHMSDHEASKALLELRRDLHWQRVKFTEELRATIQECQR